MGGFMGIGGSSAKTDRGVELGGFQDLKNTFNWALPQGQSTTQTGSATTGAGVSGLGTSMDYFNKLVSGNRATMQQAVAPETNAVLNQADAAKRQQAGSGTARGGGTAGANQTTNDAAMAKVDNALFGARPAAAAELGKEGGELAGIGLGESSVGVSEAALGEKSAADLTNAAGNSRMDSFKINQETQQNFVNAIMGAMTA